MSFSRASITTDFVLWPSAYTTHDIENTLYKDGKGDLVREVAEACQQHGLKFGIYLSPWDRNHAEYGTDTYLIYYRSQLKELFDSYAPVFEMWFDGANGGDGYYGGANETRRINGATYYDWPGTIELVRSMEPNIIFFSDAGPGVRWVGNEKGIAGETNWNLITPDTLYAGKAGIETLLNTGSENGTHWIPAETDVSIRPGWFYHAREDSLVKSPEKLFEIYLSSVGRGSTLLLNIPPDKRGRIHPNDSASLLGFKELLRREFANDLTSAAKVTGEYRGNDKKYAPGNLIDDDAETYWALNDDTRTGTIELEFDRAQQVKYVVMQEYIKLGQRVRAFQIEALIDDVWQHVGAGTTVGYKRILEVGPVTAQKIRVAITDARACPVLSEVGVY